MLKKLIEAASIRAQLFILEHFIEGGLLMMAMFFAQRVILGKTEYKDVPAKLKEQVKELLIDSGLPELVVE